MAKKKPQTHEFEPGQAIENYASVMEPDNSDAPILIPSVRQAMFQWMAELGCEKELKEVGLKPRKKLIFHGPPGCGKTTLAHHISARLGVPLVVVNMQTIVSCYVGQTGNNIDAIFRELIPQQDQCVLFMDEFDSIAEKRVTTDQGAQRERNSIVIAILQKMDAYQGALIAATNRGDDIDSAIWRRFEMQVEIGLPDADCRFAILKRYLQPFDLSDDALEVLTDATKGSTPALLRGLAESIKRDMILSPRLRYDADAMSVLKRAVASTVPHSDAATPLLWQNPKSVAGDLEAHWPPIKQASDKPDGKE